jgi:hypothetical protein
MASCDLLASVSDQMVCMITNVNLPNATKSDERRPGPRPSALLDDLVDNGPLINGSLTVDEV